MSFLKPLIVSCVFGVFLILLAELAIADQQVKISKTLPGKAIIHYPENFKPKPGETFILVKKTAGKEDKDLNLDLEVDRTHLVGINFDLSMLKYKTDSASQDVNTINFDLKYGWIRGKYEYGPLFSYSFAREQETDTKSLLIGGFFDYNFKPNEITATSLTGLRATLGLGQVDNSSQSKPSDLNRITLGAFYKWFGLAPNFAFDFDLSYLMENRTLDSTKTAISGIVGKLGVQTYF